MPKALCELGERLYDLRMRALGLDIGGTSVKAAALDIPPHPHPQATPAGRTPQTRALATSDRYARPDRPALIRAIRQAVATVAPNPAIFHAVGLCVPGRRDAAGSTVLASVNVPGLVNQRLDQLLLDALDHPTPLTAITSDAHAAALDIAATLPPAPDGPPHRLLALSLGTGVGACVLDDLAPLHVSGSSPGHLGQIDVSIPTGDGVIPIAPDGGRGGLEAYIGLPALLARLGPPADTALDRLHADDPGLLALARALRISHAIYRPHTIALLGGVGVRLQRFHTVIHALVNDHLTSIARPGWRLTFGADDHHAARGVARLAAASAART